MLCVLINYPFMSNELFRTELKPLVEVETFDVHIKRFNAFIISSNVWIYKACRDLVFIENGN